MESALFESDIITMSDCIWTSDSAASGFQAYFMLDRETLNEEPDIHSLCPTSFPFIQSCMLHGVERIDRTETSCNSIQDIGTQELFNDSVNSAFCKDSIKAHRMVDTADFDRHRPRRSSALEDSSEICTRGTDLDSNCNSAIPSYWQDCKIYHCHCKFGATSVSSSGLSEKDFPRATEEHCEHPFNGGFAAPFITADYTYDPSVKVVDFAHDRSIPLPSSSNLSSEIPAPTVSNCPRPLQNLAECALAQADEMNHYDDQCAISAPCLTSVSAPPNPPNGNIKEDVEVKYQKRKLNTAEDIELHQLHYPKKRLCCTQGGLIDTPMQMNGVAATDCDVNTLVNSSSDKIRPNFNISGKPRARKGSATDPQSVSARNRRQRINERLKILQNLVPNGTKVDISTMLEQAIYYVKFMQFQIQFLSSDEHWMRTPVAYNWIDIAAFDMQIGLKSIV